MATYTEDDIITDSLNLKIAEAIPLNKIQKVFVKLGFALNDIEKRKAFNQLGSLVDGVSVDLLSSWNNQHGRGLEAAERLKSAMEEHGVTEAVNLIQRAIEKVYPPVPRGEPMMIVDMETTPATGKPNQAK